MVSKINKLRWYAFKEYCKGNYYLTVFLYLVITSFSFLIFGILAYNENKFLGIIFIISSVAFFLGISPLTMNNKELHQFINEIKYLKSRKNNKWKKL